MCYCVPVGAGVVVEVDVEIVDVEIVGVVVFGILVVSVAVVGIAVVSTIVVNSVVVVVSNGALVPPLHSGTFIGKSHVFN